jgi:hypothetical protein
MSEAMRRFTRSTRSNPKEHLEIGRRRKCLGIFLGIKRSGKYFGFEDGSVSPDCVTSKHHLLVFMAFRLGPFRRSPKWFCSFFMFTRIDVYCLVLVSITKQTGTIAIIYGLNKNRLRARSISSKLYNLKKR